MRPDTSMESIPASVANRAEWSPLRRAFNAPTPAVRLRIEAWKRLAESGAPVELDDTQEPDFPGFRRRTGIFGSSRVYWQNMLSGKARPHMFRGHEWRGGCVVPGRLLLSHGDLVVTKKIETFSFDLVDLEGICASKSSERHFESIDDFGRDFCRYKKAAATEEDLARMLEWDQVRLINSPGSDSLCLTLWDPRLFVNNGGGSHHLAGAAYIARRLCKSVPIKARLDVSAFNPAAWGHLARDFHVLLEAPRSRGWARHAVAELLGACYLEEIPPVVGNGKLVLLPRHASASADVSAVLASRGCLDVTQHFMEIVRAQDAAITDVCKRWPHLGPALEDIKTSPSERTTSR